MKKRIALLLCLMLLSSIAAFASAEEAITLNFYSWFDEEGYLTKVIDAFNAQNPDIKVVGTFSPTTEYATKLLVAQQSGEVDVWCCNNPSEYASYVEKGMVQPLNGMIDQEKFAGLSLLIDQLAIDGNQYGLPYRKSAWVLYYNKDLFDKKSVAYPDGTWTWDKFREMAKELSYEDNGAKYYGNMTYQASQGWWRIPALTQGSVNPLEEGVLDAFKEAAQLTYDMIYEDGAMVPYTDRVGTAGSDYTGIFLQGETAMMINGDWCVEMINSAVAEKGITFNYDICEIPYYEAHGPVTVGTPSMVVMSEKTKRAEACYRFMAFLAGEEGATILAQAGMLPAGGGDKVMEAVMNKNASPANMGAFFSRQTINMAPMDSRYSPAFTILKEESSLYLLGEVSLDEAFETIQQRINDEVLGL